MRLSKILFLFIVSFGFMAASENDFLNIPCREYKKGSSQNTHMESKMSHVDTTSVVKSENGKEILLIDTTRSNNNGASSSFSMESTLKKEGNTIYVKGYTASAQGMTTQSVNVPPVPICGKVPKNFIFTSLSKNPYNTIEIKNTISIKKIGKKKIRVPAGEFEAMVFQKKIKTDIINIQNASQTETVSIEYVVDKIGIIRTDTVSTTFMPRTASISKAFPKSIKSNFVTKLVSYK